MSLLTSEEIDVWRPIRGFPCYEVSNTGRVRNIKKMNILKPGEAHGYYYVTLYGNGYKKKTLRVHVLVAAAFIGPRPKMKEINHKDCNRKNNNYSNLEYVTCIENAQYRAKYGKQIRGYTHPNSKLDWAKVLTILTIYKKKEWSNRKLGKHFSVHPTNISSITRGLTWFHLIDPK